MTALLWPAACLMAIAVMCLSALTAWRGWLDLKRLEIMAIRADPLPAEPNTATRIEFADLRERLRKLEAIATGVDP